MDRLRDHEVAIRCDWQGPSPRGGAGPDGRRNPCLRGRGPETVRCRWAAWTAGQAGCFWRVQSVWIAGGRHEV